MSWIALKMLTGDRAKFFGIVLGLTFAALLITQQGSIFCGLMLRTAAQVTDIRGADLWVMDNAVRFIDELKPLSENDLYRVRGVEGVDWAVPLYKGLARAKLKTVGPAPPGKSATEQEIIEQVILLGLDDGSLVGAPRMLHVGSLADLRRPDAIIVDRIGLRKIFPGQGWDKGANLARYVGREIEMNDHRAVIVGVCEATRTFQTNPVVYTTYSRAKQFVPRERRLLSYILAKAEPGVAPEIVAARIARDTGLKAKTSQEFMWMTIDYFLNFTGIPINFGITVMLGFLVGTAIAGQTFYNFTLDNLKQFGTLKAMGTTNLTIVRMILLQAFVTGLLGYGLGVGLAEMFGMYNLSKDSELAFFTPIQLLPITGAAIVLICVLSSLLCIRRVIVLEPAVVFRG